MSESYNQKQSGRVTPDKAPRRELPGIAAGISPAAASDCLAKAIDVVSAVKDVDGRPGEPCPVQSQTAVKILRTLFGTPVPHPATQTPAAGPSATCRAEDDGQARGLTCGMPPYVAEIVRASGGTVWTARARFWTETDAELAILKRAARLRHQLSGISRHWVTSRSEHIVDYGSHVFYGRIMAEDNWRTVRKEEWR